MFTSPCVHWSRGPKGSGCPRLLSRPGPSQAATSVSFSPRTASSSALPRHEAFIDCDLHFMSMLPAPACQHSQRTRPRGKRSSLLFNTQWSTCTRALELPWAASLAVEANCKDRWRQTDWTGRSCVVCVSAEIDTLFFSQIQDFVRCYVGCCY